MKFTDENIALSIKKAVNALQQGGVIAYPTEAVYGLGCDPFNHDAVARILTIKNRSIKKGFILIASEWMQVQRFVETIDPKALARVFATWPGPITWVFPANHHAPAWVTGEHKTVAVRVTNHPIANALCQRYGRPIISTSANIEGAPPIRNKHALEMLLGNKIDVIVLGNVGESHHPSQIRDAITGETIRLG